MTIMSQTLQQKVIEQVAWSSAALDKAERALREKSANDQQRSELIPGVVDALVRNGRIEEHEKEAASNLLTDPTKTLEILEKVAEHRSAQEIGQLGTPTGTEKVAYDSLNSPFTGVPTSQEKESDRVFRERLLGR
jgi:hypothetical protein